MPGRHGSLQKRGFSWFSVASRNRNLECNGRHRKIGDVRMVYGKRPRDPWKNRVAIVTHATALSAREIVANYERRWAIEVLFTELKGT